MKDSEQSCTARLKILASPIVCILKRQSPGNEGTCIAECFYRCRPTTFHYSIRIYHHIPVQNCSVRSSWEGRYYTPLFHLYLYVLCRGDSSSLFRVNNSTFFPKKVLRTPGKISSCYTLRLKLSAQRQKIEGVNISQFYYYGLWAIAYLMHIAMFRNWWQT